MRNIPRIVVLCLVAARTLSAAPGAVRCGKLLDVRAGKVLTDQTVVFDEKGTITAIGATNSVAIPQGTIPIDLSAATCLPGLIDVHTHLTSDPKDSGYAGLGVSVPREAITGAKNANKTLLAGFTTVRNVGAGNFTDVALRDGINAGDVPGPRMLVSGPALSITGGHGDNNLLPFEYHATNDGAADGVDGVRHMVRQNIKYGADLIKFMASGGVLSHGDNPALEQYSPEEMKAIIDTAHGLGRKVAAHAHGALGIKNAVLAGVDSIEHGSDIK